MSFVSEVTADAPGGWWRCDETSGTSAADSSGNANTGTYSGTYTQNAASLLNSDADPALTIAGGKITIATAGTLSPTTAVSCMVWFKPSALPGASSVAGLLWKAGAYGLSLEQFGGVVRWVMHVTIGGVDKSVAINVPTPTVATIYQVFGTYDGTNIKIYVNGVLRATQAQTGAISTSANSLVIGEAAGGGATTSGVIDEAAMYPTALTVTRILAQYNAGLALSRSATESLVLTESGATQTKHLGKTATESMALTESPASTAQHPRTATETSAALTSSVVQSSGVSRFATESFALSESPVSTAQHPRVASESASLTESVTLGAATRPRAATEALSLSESVSRVAGHPRAASESLVLSESAVSGSSKTRTATEASASLSESAASSGQHPRAASESMALVESATTRLLGLIRAQSESLVLAEAAVRTAQHPRTASEASMSIAESVLVGHGNTRPMTEASMALVESSVTRTLQLVRAQTEGLVLSEVATFLQGLGRFANESMAVSESPASSAQHSRFSNKTLTLVESAVRSVALSRAANEPLSLAESQARMVALMRVAAEAGLLVELPQAQQGVTRLANETAMHLAESALSGKSIVRSASESLTWLEVATFIVHSVVVDGRPTYAGHVAVRDVGKLGRWLGSEDSSHGGRARRT